MKKFISVILAVCLLSSMVINTAFATSATDNNLSINSKKEEIIKAYNEKLLEIELSSLDDTSSNLRTSNSKSKFDLKLEIQAETVKELRKLGYEAYDVNPQTFESVEETLNTDLTAVGLSDDGAYIITLNDESSIYPDAEIDDPFVHTYLGTTFLMRFMTVRATDDPRFKKESNIPILDSNYSNVIANFLDAIIAISMEEIYSPMGTVATLLGLSISDFIPLQNASSSFHAGSTWTRIYTQVWDDDFATWVFGSYVEKVDARFFLSGMYYDATTNLYQAMGTPINTWVYHSDEYYDWTWRKDNAALGYLTSSIYSDITDNVKYYYDGEVVVTHYHNF
ncbi:MAG: hypothetical protein IJB47_01970 [Oscillospiraceae bacterium]|nr:hypothetical protein [Oscillospiraceae bacterium]